MTATIVKEESEAESLALTIRSKVDSLEVTDQASYDLANIYNVDAYAAKAAFHKFDDPVHEPITEAWKASCARRKKVDDACDYTIKTTGLRCAAWRKAELDKAAEEKRKVEEELRRQAEESQIRAAEALQKDGLFAAADEVMEAAPVIAKVVVAMPIKAEGTTYTDRWSAEVSSLMALVKAVAAGTVPIAYIMANESALNAWARATKGTESIPGVRVLKTTTQGRKQG